MSQIRFINPQALAKPPGYTHVVEITAPARIVYFAGQLGVDREGKLGSDFRAQAVRAYENLKNALAAVGADFRHVVKLNNYLVDRTNWPVFREVRDSYLAANNRPASTSIAISGLARDGALIEIEAVAALPAGARSKSSPVSRVRNKGRATRPARRPSRSRRK